MHAFIMIDVYTTNNTYINNYIIYLFLMLFDLEYSSLYNAHVCEKYVMLN